MHLLPPGSTAGLGRPSGHTRQSYCRGEGGSTGSRFGCEKPGMQLLRCQHLYFCTNKASKLAQKHLADLREAISRATALPAPELALPPCPPRCVVLAPPAASAKAGGGLLSALRSGDRRSEEALFSALRSGDASLLGALLVLIAPRPPMLEVLVTTGDDCPCADCTPCTPPPPPPPPLASGVAHVLECTQRRTRLSF